jgi:hypothetical protein
MLQKKPSPRKCSGTNKPRAGVTQLVGNVSTSVILMERQRLKDLASK